MKNTTGLYKHQRDNKGARRRLTGDVVKAAMLLPVVKYEYEKARDAMKEDVTALVSTLRGLLPLAEAYLKGAPSDPANAILEDARWLLVEHGPSTGESPTGLKQASSGSSGRALHFTAKERSVMRWAISSLLAGEMEDAPGDRAALNRALDKLQ